MTHEQALPPAKGQGAVTERDLFPASENEAKNGLVQGGLEGARLVLPEQHEALRRLDDRIAAVYVSRSFVDECFQHLRRRHCILLSDGAVKCWGSNNENALNLNNSDITYSAVPVTIAGLPKVAQLTSAEFALCALTTGGGVKCWGYNDVGTLGNGTLGNGAERVPA